ncbi:exo-alpha-sialidase [Methylobrevis sp. L22]|uniref:Exo-alpha-sialidase n=2 Tax=Methylobrevis albus TaxID=2793297 RepID=A0A931N050_9HYPH|nr:exo-alpha-sialidase [Methylobrevis albus]
MDGLLRPSPLGRGLEEAFLPSPCIQNHAANLHVLPGGALACVWFGGSQEGASDISIWMARLEPGAAEWSPAERMSDDPARSEQNPVLFTAPTGDVWLFWTAQRFGNQDTAIVRRRISTDGGMSFGPIEVFIDTSGTFVRQPIVVTPAGRWLLPVFACVARPGEKWTGDHDTSAVLFSDDEGLSWRRTEVPHSTGCVHMNIAPDADGFLAVYRSRFADAVHVSRSADGLAWSAPEPGSLPNNNSSIQLIARRGGGHAIVYNHVAAGDGTARRLNLYDEIEDEDDIEGAAAPGPAAPAAAPPPARTAFWGTPRAPLSLAFTADGARSFAGRLDLDGGDGYCLTNNSKEGLNRELSYPSITEGADGTLHVAYTYHRRAIKYVRLPPG